MDLIRRVSDIYRSDADWNTQILVASVRTPVHVIEAAQAGADGVTVPFSVIRQMEQHPLTDRGIAQFLEDAGRRPR